jgi:2',3'-cyclic-nucleotide 2'-phosphodiesterase (5'-nucleotidase family)
MRRILWILVLALAVAGWAGERWQLTVLHTNDLHGMLLPFTYNGAEAGGLARRASLIAAQRKEIDHALALIDCGDVFTRGPWHTRFYGAPEIAALNVMGYDMFCVGNNEFKAKDGPESQGIMLSLLRRSRFPWLAANLTMGDTGVPVPGINPFIVRDYGGVRVGFLGLTAPRSKDYAQTRGWTISDPIATARKWVPEVRKECDILIAVTHIGVDLDRELATVPGIDAIIGGDSHTTLQAPVVINGVPIVQAGEQGVWLGRLDLTFEKGAIWKLVDYTGKLIPVDKTVPDDPAMKALLDRWLAPAKTSLLPVRLPLAA